MSSASKHPPITVEQYLGFKAPKGYRDELIEGEIVVSPGPKPQHHDVALNIFRSLEQGVSHGFCVGMRMNFRMPQRNSMPSPDIWVMDSNDWRAAREADIYPLGSPILAVEVISPANRKPRVEQKTNLYLEGGATEVWCVYPRKEEVTVHSQGGRVVYQNLPDQAIPLPSPLGVQVSISDIFRVF
jgi:Uma2 family endonuclease